MVTATSLTSATPEIERFNIAGTSESETTIFPPAIACVKTLPLLKYTAFTLSPYFVPYFVPLNDPAQIRNQARPAAVA